MFFTFDASAFDWFVNDAAMHYEKSSPLVGTWLDQVCERVSKSTVLVAELQKVAFLQENEIWLDPNGAGNLAYKALKQFGELPANVTIAF